MSWNWTCSDLFISKALRIGRMRMSWTWTYLGANIWTCLNMFGHVHFKSSVCLVSWECHEPGHIWTCLNMFGHVYFKSSVYLVSWKCHEPGHIWTFLNMFGHAYFKSSVCLVSWKCHEPGHIWTCLNMFGHVHKMSKLLFKHIWGCVLRFLRHSALERTSCWGISFSTL